MTNPNDSINSFILKKAHLNEETGSLAISENMELGLTKREYFAAMRKDPIYGDAALPLSIAVSIMGDNPPNDYLENVKWWIMATEKFAVMRADALINALNQQQ